MKFLMKSIKKFNKLNFWYKMLLILGVLIIIISTVNKFKKKEGFDGKKKFVNVKGDKIFDDFYCNIYDDLVYDEGKQNFEIKEIKRTTDLNKKSKLLDVGSGTGHHVGVLNKQNIDAEGVDKSSSMIAVARKKYPKSTYKKGDVMNSMTYEPLSFSHITCLYFTIYLMKNKSQFFKNTYEWLQPGGYLILHLVNRDQFDPILNTADPLYIVSAQKYAKERITNSNVKFKDFQYKANFSLDKKNNLATFKETMKDDKTGNVRQNHHSLYMDTQKNILSLAKEVGFILKGKIDMVSCMYEYQYLYILYKPN